MIERARDVLFYGKRSGHRSSKAILERNFDAVDTDSSGTISTAELRQCAGPVGYY